MKSDERGFTYPLTLCTLLLFLIFFSMHIEQLLSEHKMAVETATILKQEYYFLSSAKKVESLYQTRGTIPAKGTFVYINGTMDYKAETPSAYVQIVDFTLVLHLREPIVGYGYFDTRSKSLIKWVEVK
ncbi:competence type IV pilus minor pilin ComGG [Neobacillus cucumis]|uniref:competence type IV pilus minor pilin ComGG n=1 Tax=Neobacillus cucumis TaxID=1740721 RepID=UPI002852F86C|nr:competence type IV pilus minor pilin ComGG [Neobacillus cucumis]MDR4948575.1 competence type IV pilus minor pilin ComGG [Neobacillus cucumis]